MGRDRVRSWYPVGALRVGAPLWLLVGCGILVLVGHRGQTSALALCLVVWASMWIPYAVACRARGTARRDLERLDARRILLWALLFRVVLLFAGLPADSPATAWSALRDDLGGEVAGYAPFLLWDNDVWRYLWDGHIGDAELSPYRTTPQEVLDAADAGEPWAEELVERGPWLDVLDAVSYRDHPSVYPPLAVGLFRLSHTLAPGSVFVWKSMLVVLEWSGCVLFVLLLRATGRSIAPLIWLAWNPLLLKEVAGSGHLEGALIPLLVATLFAVATQRQALAATALAAAAALKLWPVLLAPALLLRARPWTWCVFLGALTLGLMPWSNDLTALLEALRSFAGSWVFNPGSWLLFEAAAKGLGAGDEAGSWARAVHLGFTLLVVLATGVVAIRSRRSSRDSLTIEAKSIEAPSIEVLSRDWLWILSAYLLLAPTVMPWYLTVALPMAALIRFWPWLVVTSASVLSYLIYVLHEELLLVLVLEHAAITGALFLWAGLWWRQRSIGPGHSAS